MCSCKIEPNIDPERNTDDPIIVYCPMHNAAKDLLAALTWLLDDITDAKEDRNPETGQEYDSVTTARNVIREAQG